MLNFLPEKMKRTEILIFSISFKKERAPKNSKRIDSIKLINLYIFYMFPFLYLIS